MIKIVEGFLENIVKGVKKEKHVVAVSGELMLQHEEHLVSINF
jgi:hypothetical protein